MSSRRVSLRRKRGPRDERGDSPLSKRVSPSVEDHDITDYQNRIHKNSSQKMAAAMQPPSTPKNSINITEHTIVFSPDTPLMCSQIMGTQECEVVWDCNSPGFSKEDLKKMCNGDDASPIPIMPPPQRTLFPMALRNRSVSGRLISSGKSTQASEVAAQLNALLQNIPSKDAITEEVVDGVFSESTTPEMDDSYGVSTSLLEELTQPFQISGVEQVTEEDHSNKKILKDKIQNKSLNDEEEMELNSPKTFAQNVRARSSVPSLSESLAEDMNMSMNMSALDMNMAVTDVSCMSADLFDDDLFNDSVMIRTTQAVEAESFDPRKVIKSTPVAVDIKNNNKLCSASSDESVGPSPTSTSSNLDLGSSPVLLGKFRSPANVPTRKIRNTFSLGSFVSPVYKKEDSLKNALKESNQTSVNNIVITKSNTNLCKSESTKGNNLGLKDTETEKILINDKRVSSNVKSSVSVNISKVSRLTENTNSFVSKNSNIVKSNNKIPEKSAVTIVNQRTTYQQDKLDSRNNQGTKISSQSISDSSYQQSRNNQGTKIVSQSISNSSYQQSRFKQPQSQSNLLTKNIGNKMPRSKSTSNAVINSTSSSSLRRINSSDTPSPKCALTDRFNSAVDDFQFKEFEDDDDFFATVLEDESSNTTIDTVSSSIPNKQDNSKMSLFTKNLQSTKNFSRNVTSSNIIANPPSVYEKAKQFNSFSGITSTTSSTKDGFQRATMSSGQVLKGDKSSPKKFSQVASNSSCSSTTVSRVLMPNSESLTHTDMLDDDDDLFQDDHVLTAIEEVEIQYTQSQIQDSQESYTRMNDEAPFRCSQEEISRKRDEAMRRRIERQKEEALRRREERQRQRNQSGGNK